MNVTNTPLFQLNLAIWLSLPSPPEAGDLFPVFYHSDFQVRGIGPPLPVPEDHFQSAKDFDIDLNRNCGPDLLLINRESGDFLTIECKKSSFGPEPDNGSHPSQQAYSLLCLTGNHLEDHISPSHPDDTEWSNYLLYMLGPKEESPDDPPLEKWQVSTLDELSDDLQASGIAPIPGGALFIESRKEEGIYLRSFHQQPNLNPIKDTPHNSDTKISDNIEDWVQISLIPWDPSIGRPTDKQIRILQERIRVSIASNAIKGAEKSEFKIGIEDILSSAIESWELWRDNNAKKAVRRKVRKILDGFFELLEEYVGSKEFESNLKVKRNQNVWRVEGIGDNEREALTSFVSNAGFRKVDLEEIAKGDSLPDLSQLELFD